MDDVDHGYVFAETLEFVGVDRIKPTCGECKDEIYEEICYVGPDRSTICRECYNGIRVDVESPARIEEAIAECEVTRTLQEYDPSCEWRPTREEYEMGSREAYTPNAYLCHCRHNCTNYDDLIRDLDTLDPVDRAVYSAIRERIGEMVEQCIRSSNTEQVANYIINSTFEPSLTFD